jgi:hypothetical protein
MFTSFEFRGRRDELEHAFYRDQKQHILDRLRAKRESPLNRMDLARICGVDDPVFLDKLTDHACPEHIATLVFVPLLVVAWADGSLSSEEQGVILDAAEDFGIKRGSPAFNLLGLWLSHEPTRELRKAWVEYVRALTSGLDSADRKRLAESLLHHAYKVAELIDDSWMLGPLRRRSRRRVLRKLASAFGPTD